MTLARRKSLRIQNIQSKKRERFEQAIEDANGKEKKTSSNGNRNRLLRPTKSSLAKSSSRKNNGLKEKKSENTAVKHGKLTVPRSPKFHHTGSSRSLGETERLSTTSRELQQIKKQKMELEEKKIKTRKYREKTQSITVTSQKKGNSFMKTTLQASGVVGIPTIKRQKLTEVKPFSFQVDKRAQSKKPNVYESEDQVESKKKFQARDIPEGLLKRC